MYFASCCIFEVAFSIDFFIFFKWNVSDLTHWQATTGNSLETAPSELQSDIISSLLLSRSCLTYQLHLIRLIMHITFTSYVYEFIDIHDQTLVWIRSYLSDRLVNVLVFYMILFSGLFCLHNKHVSDIIHRFGLLHNSYCDDTQLLKRKTVLLKIV